MAVYLDHNATTPLDPRVLEAMLPFLQGAFANPSSPHRPGRAARDAVEAAREQVAALVGAHPSQVIFTSGGTEANNLALKGAALGRPGARIAVSAVEHPSVLEPAEALGRLGWQLDRIPVDAAGRVAPQALEERLPGVALVSVMLANNETGVVQEIAPLAAMARSRGVLFHTDAVQAAGKIPVDFKGCGASLMSLSAHKISGPKGAGALVTDRSVELLPLLHGGGQERGMRGGTENVAAIVGFGRAAELAKATLAERRSRLFELRGRLEGALAERLPQALVFAREALRLPNTLFLALPGIEGQTLVLELDRRGFAVSAGSACGTGSDAPSHVLSAMGVPREIARCAVRVSLGITNTEHEIDALVGALEAQAARFGMAAAVWA